MTDVDRDAVERIRLMLRRFLAERFKLLIHYETRQLRIFQAGDCNDHGPAHRRAPPAEVGWRIPQGRWQIAGVDLRFHPDGWGRTKSSATAVSMGSLAHSMSDWVQRHGCRQDSPRAGPIDCTLTWAPESDDRFQRSIDFTAVQDKLGLESWSQPRGPVDVLVVDSAEKPVPGLKNNQMKAVAT